MSRIEDCPFCDPAKLEGRIIHEDDLIISFLSDPKFVDADVHALVVPRRHIEPPQLWRPEELVAVGQEVQRLQAVLLTKYVLAPDFMRPMPDIPQGYNGTKVDHAHRHVLAGGEDGRLLKVGILWGDREKDFEALRQESIQPTLAWLARAA